MGRLLSVISKLNASKGEQEKEPGNISKVWGPAICTSQTPGEKERDERASPDFQIGFFGATFEEADGVDPSHLSNATFQELECTSSDEIKAQRCQ